MQGRGAGEKEEEEETEEGRPSVQRRGPSRLPSVPPPLGHTGERDAVCAVAVGPLSFLSARLFVGGFALRNPFASPHFRATASGPAEAAGGEKSWSDLLLERPAIALLGRTSVSRCPPPKQLSPPTCPLTGSSSFAQKKKSSFLEISGSGRMLGKIEQIKSTK